MKERSRVDGLSICELAQKCRVHRRTVRQALTEAVLGGPLLVIGVVDSPLRLRTLRTFTRRPSSRHKRRTFLRFKRSHPQPVDPPRPAGSPFWGSRWPSDAARPATPSSGREVFLHVEVSVA